VTVLAILQAILGLLLFFGFLAPTVVGFGLPELFLHLRIMIPLRMFSIALVLLTLALVEFVLAFGLWHGVGWVWFAALGVAILGTVFAVLALFLRPGIGETISLIVNLVIVYYLMQPQTHTFFRKSSPESK
jgi:uncharacterized membrane protein (DUF2068 family)